MVIDIILDEPGFVVANPSLVEFNVKLVSMVIPAIVVFTAMDMVALTVVLLMGTMVTRAASVVALVPGIICAATFCPRSACLSSTMATAFMEALLVSIDMAEPLLCVHAVGIIMVLFIIAIVVILIAVQLPTAMAGAMVMALQFLAMSIAVDQPI
jgi:hypothetical protein